MSNNIRGITIEFGGDTGPLSTALKGVNKTAGDLQSELTEVNKQLKFDPANTDLLKQKEDLLKQSTQALTEKQATLKTGLEQIKKQVESGDYGKKLIDSAEKSLEKVNTQLKNGTGDTEKLKAQQKELTSTLAELQSKAASGDLGAEKVRAVEREYEKVTSQLKDTKKDLTDVESQVGTFSEKVKSKFTNIKDSIKSAFSSENIKTALGTIGAATGAFLKSSLDEAGEAEKANADLAQTLKSTGGAAGMTIESLDELSKSLSESTTFSDDEVKSGESMLLTFTNIGQDVFPQATSAVLDYAQKMGVDAKSAALTLGKALNDPTDGLSKLTRSGVTFTDQQQEQIKAMQAAGDTAGAQKLMIDELNKEFGGQATAAADTYEGKQKQLANTMTEVKETIGSALMPMLANLLKSITPIIQTVAKFVTDHPKVTAGILAVIAVMGTLIGGVSLVNTVLGAFNIQLTASQVLLTGGVMLAIMALVAAAALIIKNWGPISQFFINLWDGIKNVFSGIGAWFENVFGSAASGVQNAWSGITGFFGGIWSGIQDAFSAVGDWFGNIFESAKQGIYDHFNPSAISDWFAGIWDDIKNGFSALNPFEWGADLINGLADGIRNAADHVQQAVGNVAQNIRNFLHFSVPDEGPLTDYESWMPDFMSGLARGIDSNKNKVVSAMRSLASDMSIAPTVQSAYASGTASKTLSSTVNHNFGNTIIKVYGASGQSEKELARTVGEVFNNDVQKKAGAFE